MVWLPPASRSVAPSVALATLAVPTVPPAPGRFSTITLRPSAAPSSALNERATMSCTPPAAKGTTMRMTLPCPQAAVAARENSKATSRFTDLALVGRLERQAAALAAGRRALARLGAEAEQVAVRGLGGLAHVFFGDGLALERVAVLAFHVRPRGVTVAEGRYGTPGGYLRRPSPP